ncbi:MAG: hypothetical protein NPIRA02_22260 [Nitrospirales bacterium]|nr:MAG: hypothetical protein NPIRA02_22260 [Nitrospirales bacterium]
MSTALRANDHERVEGKILEQAVSLLSQQVWCWGRDIVRPEGNWLLEIGFDRIEPPANRKDCSSVYTLTMPRRRCVALRGFGVFYGDGEWGGVFLPRFTFHPRYTTQATLNRPPWSDADLPTLNTPTKSQQQACAMLTLDLIDWIHRYEVNIVKQLGIEYRRSTLLERENGTRRFVPAENFASAWHELSCQVASNFNVFLEPRQ